jgi:hypothetical protein
VIARRAMTPIRLLVLLIPALAAAAGNWAVLQRLGVAPAAVPWCVAWLIGSPFVLVALAALLGVRRGRAPVGERTAAPAPPPPPPPEPREDAALELLGLLQQEGRFVDFLQEDLAPYPDEQIGAAVRGIHEGCRKALAERVGLETILRGAEGETVTVEPGFDPAAVRLTGNVHGEPPFTGVLRHAGWRATRAALPARRGQDPRVIAPAEIEIP